MNETTIQIKRALISVSNKEGVIELAHALTKLHIEIISTGGTSQFLRHAHIPVRDVSEVTEFPEMMEGRVKTLHPKIHGGILGLRDAHAEVAAQHNIPWIDLVVVNLYPFSDTVQKPECTWDDAIENIDIGGPTLIRAAAKNMGWVGVVVDSSDYPIIITELKNQNRLTFETRKQLAAKAFQHTAEYDAKIYQYLTQSEEELVLHFDKCKALRYGENPHQAASAWHFKDKKGILTADQYQGKELSYNNITDADAAVACIREFSEPACVIVKHANPCGVAVADTIENAFDKAFQADSTSAFGGIIAINRACTKELAEKISQIFFEVIIAPSYTSTALEILSKKPKLRVLSLDLTFKRMEKEFKFIEGGLLIQDKNIHKLNQNELTLVTKRPPSEVEIDAMLFAWPIVKHIKSNAVLIAKKNVTLGIGAGQVSRIDAVDIAIKKAGNDLSDAIVASDAFFPFRDSIDHLAKVGIRAIIQPGGSLRDAEVIAACDEYDIAMVLTGQRCFKH